MAAVLSKQCSVVVRAEYRSYIFASVFKMSILAVYFFDILYFCFIVALFINHSCNYSNRRSTI